MKKKALKVFYSAKLNAYLGNSKREKTRRKTILNTTSYVLVYLG